MMNERQASEITFLREQIISLGEQHKKTLDKILGTQKRQDITIPEDFTPVGGYTPLRQRIADLEAESQIEFNKINKDSNAD